MRIIFIRHGEPDYTTDTLTGNGVREADALVARTSQWNVEQFYVSPLGRAQLTAAPTLAARGQEAITLPWLREFNVRVVDPITQEPHCAWDLMPQTYAVDPVMYDPMEWIHSAFYSQYPEVAEQWQLVREGIDGLLAQYGYIRNGAWYDFVDPTGHVNPAGIGDLMLHGTHTYEIRDTDDERTIVMVCHMGITCVILGYLMGISPVILWHTTCIPTTGVTVINAEKRLDNVAHWRLQLLGDTRHLQEAGLPVSGYAAFSPLFQQ